ncbi:mitochondrial substrate carrier family protein [Heterostelium album PN500]|uniref:Mitochondrial substrate carrier family protein n=1 Tax=Heterostelium pallidum (strain ATCC 26659 / Pp 5 / PN500) TaxID=670386 RepID=D3BTS7_HETP5|nr:mitochondrial substrate carrier family protein [Heterostelium album PN500]EFA75113.1 mitochondrial substrate carrier family protein [Heterostelium album PN500]|eukprot:XP_020427247.1 mitochondrial substrate carrier family protein [Heterostelium album PN500]
MTDKKMESSSSSALIENATDEDADPLAGALAGISRSLTRVIGRGGIAGSFSGMAEETAGYPLELVKTRLQVHSNPNISFLNVVREVYQKEGVVGMFRGLSSPLVASAMISAIQFTSFEKTNHFLHEEYRMPDPYRYMISGGTAGLLQSFIICPVDVVKSRMMISGMGHGGSAGGGGAGVGTLQMARAIMAQDGLKGFYTGMSATLLRDVPGLAVFFTTYEGLKDVLGVESEHGSSSNNNSNKNDNNNVNSSSSNSSSKGSDFLKILLAGGLAGSAYHSSTHCFDIAKTLIQTQVGTPKYRGTFDCLNQLVRREGIRGLFRGYFTTLVKSFPANAAGFMVYELVQKV